MSKKYIINYPYFIIKNTLKHTKNTLKHTKKTLKHTKNTTLKHPKNINTNP